MKEYLETLKPEERERIIVRRLRWLLKHAYRNSPYYHEAYKKIGLDIDSIRSLDDFSRKVPVTTKAILREEQARYPPFGRILAGDVSKVSIIMASSGTTGKPTYVPFSEEEMEFFSEAHARIMSSFGIKPGMKIMISALFSLYAGSWGVYLGSLKLGLYVIPMGAGLPGITSQAVRVAQDHRPEVLYGTPSYILHFLETAKKMGVKPPEDFAFKVVFGSGEAGLSLPSIKKRIKSLLGEAVKVIDTGSMVEAMPWMTNAECEYENGMHLWQDIVYTELVDPTETSLVAFGEEGVLTYTSLHRRLYPLIRYYSGDISMWTSDPCPCGRTYPRLPKGIYGRVDDMFAIKGVKIWPSFVQEVLERSPIYNGEFRILLRTQDGADTMKVLVEATEEAWSRITRDESARKEMEAEIRRLLRDHLTVSCDVEIIPPNTFERQTHKARRVLDEREASRELERLARVSPG